MKKILHIAYDNTSQDYFLKFLCEERLDEQNDILLCIDGDLPKKVGYFHHPNIKLVQLADSPRTLDEYLSKDYSMLVIHFLKVEIAQAIINTQSKIKIAWAFWGADGYGLHLVNNLYSRKTIGLDKSLSWKANLYLDAKRRVIRTLRLVGLFEPILAKTNGLKIFRNESTLYKALLRVDYCLTHVKEDFTLLVSTYQHLNLTWNNFFYLPQNTSGDKFISSMKEGIVLVGNSGNPSNNHADVLLTLSNQKESPLEVICPMSYGSPIGYNNAILQLNSTNTKLNLNVITRFESLPKWEERMNEVSVVFFNHYRQQGLGNVVFLLCHGKRVYLNSKSTTYQYLKGIGCIVFKFGIDKISYQSLTMEETDINRKCIESSYSPDKFVLNWENITDVLVKN